MQQRTYTVEHSELETLKQQAMEIALRINVLQGGNLLDELTPAPAPEPVQSVTVRKWRAMEQNEKNILMAYVIASTVCLIAVFALDKPIFFLVAFVIHIAYGIYNNRKKNQRQRKGVAK